MALPNPWDLDTAPSNQSTSVSVDQLAAQGGKYTPEQMAAFDKGRGQMLAMETNSGNPQATPDPREIQNLNPIQKTAFDDSTTPPWQMSSQQTQNNSPKPWELPQEQSTFDKISDRLKQGINLGISDMKDTLSHPLQTMKGNMAAAVDMAAIPVTGTIGMAGYLGSLAAGQGMAKSSENFAKIQQALTVGNYLDDPKTKDQYAKGMSLLSWAMDKMHQGGESITDQMLKSDIPFIRDNAALGGALTEAIENVVVGAGVVKGIGVVGKIGKLAKGDASDIPPPSSGAPATQQTLADKMGLTGSKSADGQAGPPGTFMVKGKPVEAGSEESLGVDTSPEEMDQQFNSRQGGFNFNPLDQGQTGDLYDPSNRRAVPDMTPEQEANIQFAARQGELEPLNPNEPPKPAAVPPDYIKQFEEGGGLKAVESTKPQEPIPQTQDILSDENQAKIKSDQEESAWDKYKRRVQENQQAQFEQDAKYASDNFEPEQGTQPVEKMQPPITNRSGAKFLGRKQRGAAGDLGDAQRLDQLVKGLLVTDRNPDNFKAGDTVRMMNGKLAKVLKVTDDGRFQVRNDDGSFDTVHRQGINYKFKPANQVLSDAKGYPKRPNPNPNAGKFGQGGAVNVRNIFQAKDPTLKDEVAKGPSIPLDDDAMIDLLYKQWNRSSTPEDFKDGLTIEKQHNDAIPSDIIKDSDLFYNHFENGWRPDSSVYGKMTSLNQRETADTRPFLQMMKETILGKKAIKNKETGEYENRDYSLTQGKLKANDDLNLIKKEIFDPLHIISTSWEKPSGKVYNNIYSNIADIHQQWNAKLNRLMNFNKPFLRLSRKEQLNVLDADTYWDNNTNRQILSDQQLDWPTKEMLMDKQYTGLTSSEADAYLSRAKGRDEGFKAANIDQPKLPGYMGHMWSGFWRTNMYHPEEGLVEVRKTFTKSGALKWKEEAEKRGLMAEVIDPSLSSKHGFVARTQQMIQAANNMGKLGKAFARQLIDMQDNALQGTITESLERRGISGYIGEGGTKPESLLHPTDYIKARYENNKFRSGYEKEMNDFARAGKNRAIVEAIAKPFFQNINKFENTPNLIDAVKDLISTATGFRAQENIAFDRMIKQFFINRGLPPNLPKQMINVLNTIVRTERINSANVGFAAEHMAFALPGIWDLNRMHIERGIAGEKQGNFWNALGTMGKDAITWGLWKSDKANRAQKWAVANGVFKSNYYDHPEFRGLAGQTWNLATHKLLEMFINRARSVSFQMAYRYFSDIMPEQQALKAAANHVKKTMQSFEAIDTPEIFKEGYGGRSIRPFNQIHFYNMARALEQTSAYLRTLKDNPLAAQKLLIPLAGLSATYVALGGARGVPFHNDWNIVRKYLLENNPDLEFARYSLEELMMKIGFPDWVTFGAIPHATGADIRNTFGFNLNPEDVISGAGFEALERGVRLGIQGVRKAVTGEADADAIYNNTRALMPTTAIPWYEDAKAEKLGGNIPHATRLDPMSPRTPEEDLFYKLTSKRPISESERDEKTDIQKEHEANDAKWREYRTRLIVNNILGFDTGSKDVSNLVSETVNANRGYDINTLGQTLSKAIPERQLPEAIKFIQEAAKSNDFRKASILNNLLQTMHGGDLGK